MGRDEKWGVVLFVHDETTTRSVTITSLIVSRLGAGGRWVRVHFWSCVDDDARAGRGIIRLGLHRVLVAWHMGEKGRERVGWLGD